MYKRQGAGGALVAHGGDGLRRRADEDQSGRRAGAGEAGILGQEAVAGMDGLSPGQAGGFQDGGNVEIGLGRRSRAEAKGGVGLGYMDASRIGIGIDGHGANAQAAAGADDAAGDLTSIGDEDGLKVVDSQFDLRILRGC